MVFAPLVGIPVPPPAEEETLWAYELGYKSRLGGGKVLFEVAAFYNDWQDLIFSAPLIPEFGFISFINAGSAEIPGIEIALRAGPTTR